MHYETRRGKGGGVTYCTSKYSGTSLILTSNIWLLGLSRFDLCAFYLMPMMRMEQRSFEGRKNHVRMLEFRLFEG